jgi:acetyl-CoA carboxylase carboxyltransferase component
MIAVMGPEAAVNAVYFNKIQEVPEADRPAFVARLREEYKRDLDVQKLAGELVIDGIVAGEELRGELARRLERYSGKREERPRKKHAVTPV